MCKKFSDKLDHLFWWFIWLLPIAGGLLAVATGTHDFTGFSDFVSGFTFSFVEDILVDVFATATIQLPMILVTLMSYIVSVELCHVLVDVLLLIPRFCHKLVQLDTYVDTDKWGGRRV